MILFFGRIFHLRTDQEDLTDQPLDPISQFQKTLEDLRLNHGSDFLLNPKEEDCGWKQSIVDTMTADKGGKRLQCAELIRLLWMVTNSENCPVRNTFLNIVERVASNVVFT